MTTTASALSLDFWRSASTRIIHLYSFSAQRHTKKPKNPVFADTALNAGFGCSTLARA